MKRAAYLLLCLLAAAGGLFAGRHLRPEGAAAASSAKPRAAVAAPAEAAAKAKTLPPLKGYARLRRHTLSAATGDTAALPMLLKSCDGDPAALYILMDAWMAKNPAAFLRAMGESLVAGDLALDPASTVLSDAGRLLSKQDHTAAVRVAAELPASYRSWALGQVVWTLSETDPEAAIRLALDYPGISPPGASEELLGRRDLLPLIRQLHPNAGRTSMMEYALRGAPLSEAIQTFAGSTEYMDVSAFSRYLRNAELPAAELMTAQQTATGPWKVKLAEAAAESLIQDDPAAAVTWIDDHLSGSRRNQFLEKLAEQKSDPEAAAAAQALLPEKPAQEADAKK